MRLAVPALGALAAEPPYLLVDTAIVGHLGTTELAALALAATVLGAVVALCNFLAYGTTAQVARLHGAGQDARAGALAAQALWLALAIGIVVALVCVAAADPIMALLGGGSAGGGRRRALPAPRGARHAVRADRARRPGLPARRRRPAQRRCVILVVANLVNVVLEVVLVYGFDLGLDGSALGTVVAQLGMGVAFAVLLLRAPARAARGPRRAPSRCAR